MKTFPLWMSMDQILITITTFNPQDTSDHVTNRSKLRSNKNQSSSKTATSKEPSKRLAGTSGRQNASSLQVKRASAAVWIDPERSRSRSLDFSSNSRRWMMRWNLWALERQDSWSRPALQRSGLRNCKGRRRSLRSYYDDWAFRKLLVGGTWKWNCEILRQQRWRREEEQKGRSWHIYLDKETLKYSPPKVWFLTAHLKHNYDCLSPGVV